MSALVRRWQYASKDVKTLAVGVATALAIAAVFGAALWWPW